MKLSEEALSAWQVLNETHSWEEVLEPGERIGGPSPYGNSRYQDFKTCPRLFWIRNIRGLRRTIPDPNLEIGGLVHEALARYFRSALDGGTNAEDLDALWSIVDRASSVTPTVASEARRLLRGWLAMYGPGTQYDMRRRVLRVEPVVLVERPFPYSAALDLVLDAGGGQVDIVEHKTSSRYDQALLTSYRMEAQFLGHLWLAQQAGMKVRRYLVDLIVKTASPRYEHIQINATQLLVDNWRRETLSVAKEIAAYIRGSSPWPQRTTYRCRFCDAFDYCASGCRSYEGWACAPGFRTNFAINFAKFLDHKNPVR